MSPMYLALGDSLTTGYGVEPSSGFASLYFYMLSERLPNLSYVNQGINGLTTSRLASLLQTNRRLRNLTVGASLVTLTIGSNDFLHLAQLVVAGSIPDLPAFFHRFQSDLNRLGEDLRHMNPKAPLLIASLYNPLPAGPYREYARQGQSLLDEANAILGTWVRMYGATLVPVDRAFRRQEALVVGPDHIHPNRRGHALIADLFARAY